MRKIICLILLIYCTNSINAQTSFNIDLSSPGATNGFGMIRITNPSTLGTKVGGGDINYDEIAGRPFFNDKWMPAVLILTGNMSLKLDKVKLNLYTAEILYVDSTGKEMSAGAGIIKKIFFLDPKDSSKTIAVFQKITGVEDKPQGAFIQLLNSGKIELLKLTQVVLHDGGYDALRGKNNYSFQSKITYYILNDGVVSPLKAANKDDVTALVPPNAAAQTWLDANKNKLKNEADIVGYLAYYNTNN